MKQSAKQDNKKTSKLGKHVHVVFWFLLNNCLLSELTDVKEDSKKSEKS